MPVRDYCRGDPSTAAPGDSLRAAAQEMEKRGVGCLVVVDGTEQPIGMITDRDIALGVLREGLDPEDTAVERVMHEPVITVTGKASLGVALRFMRQNGLRRIPVVDNQTGRLLGLFTCDDFLQLASAELEGVAEVVRSQFPAELSGRRALAAETRE